ncbi:MAG: hypothetical protein PHE60_05755 [Sulfurospirillaceae bacterium]|nr:hypothetical protein [Sulfurospirillaceae bacterium]
MDLKELQKTVIQLELISADLKGLKNLDMSSIVEQVYTLNDEFEQVQKNLKSTQHLGLKFVLLSVFCSILSFFALGYVQKNNYFGLLSGHEQQFETIDISGKKYYKVLKKTVFSSPSDNSFYLIQVEHQ